MQSVVGQVQCLQRNQLEQLAIHFADLIASAVFTKNNDNYDNNDNNDNNNNNGSSKNDNNNSYSYSRSNNTSQ